MFTHDNRWINKYFVALMDERFSPADLFVQRLVLHGKNGISAAIALITRNIVCLQLDLICQAKRLRFSRSSAPKTRCLYDCRNISRVPKADSDEEASAVVSGAMFTAANGTGARRLMFN